MDETAQSLILKLSIDYRKYIAISILSLVNQPQRGITMFDIQNLRDTIDQKIEAVEASEKITRDILRDLSRDVLYALHEHGDIGFVNRVMAAKTTPINKKALRLFSKNSRGFS